MALPQTLRDELAAKRRDERVLSERDKRRGLALWVLGCCAWSWLGIFCLAWSMHTTSQAYGGWRSGQGSESATAASCLLAWPHTAGVSVTATGDTRSAPHHNRLTPQNTTG